MILGRGRAVLGRVTWGRVLSTRGGAFITFLYLSVSLARTGVGSPLAILMICQFMEVQP